MSYSKQKMAKDERGFVRYLGIHNGKQFKFRLGDDEQKALIAKAMLEALWQRASKEANEWDELTLTIAKAIAKGQSRVSLAPTPQHLDPMTYLNWIHDLVDKFGDLVHILPEQIDLYQAGAKRVDAVERQFRIMVAEQQESLRQLASTSEIPGSLHEALDDYIAYLKAKENDHSGWGKTQVREAEILRRRHEDIPLARLNLQAMEDMLTFWAKRPKVRNKDKPMSALSCRNFMKRLRDFWKWLHRSEKYAWRRPEDYDELKVRIASIPTDREAKLKSICFASVESGRTLRLG